MPKLNNGDVTFESGSEDSDDDNMSDSDFALSGTDVEVEGESEPSSLPESLAIKSYRQHKEKVADAPDIPGAVLVRSGTGAIVYSSAVDYESRRPQTNSTYDCVAINGWHTRAVRIQELSGPVILYALNDKNSDEAAVRALRSAGVDGKRAITGGRALTAKCATSVIQGKGAAVPPGTVCQTLFSDAEPVICEELARALASKSASDAKPRKKVASKEKAHPEKEKDGIKKEAGCQAVLNPEKPLSKDQIKRSPKKVREKSAVGEVAAPAKSTAKDLFASKLTKASPKTEIAVGPANGNAALDVPKKRTIEEVLDVPEVTVNKKSRTVVITITM